MAELELKVVLSESISMYSKFSVLLSILLAVFLSLNGVLAWEVNVARLVTVPVNNTPSWGGVEKVGTAVVLPKIVLPINITSPLTLILPPGSLGVKGFLIWEFPRLKNKSIKKTNTAVLFFLNFLLVKSKEAKFNFINNFSANGIIISIYIVNVLFKLLNSLMIVLKTDNPFWNIFSEKIKVFVVSI